MLSIKSIHTYQVLLPLHEGSYNWSGGNSISTFDSTVVVIRTNDPDIYGVGEVTPLGPSYLPAYAKGCRQGIAELAPHLLGENPLEIAKINAIMDRALLGHPYVKSPLDMACWDILGKVSQQPLCVLLGGRFGQDVALYRAISQRSPEEMVQNVDKYRQLGYTKFQLKVGGGGQGNGVQVVEEDIRRIVSVANAMKPGEVLVADANTGWLLHEATRVVAALPARTDVYIEQPCKSYEECLSLRKRISHPFVLDENIDSMTALLRAYQDAAMDVINLKISKVGGIYKAKQIRDMCVHFGIAMTIEDSWGGDIVTAAIAHLAHSTPERFRFSSTDFNSYVSVSNATGAPTNQRGFMRASTSPGLGVEPRWEVLGDPIATFE